MFLSLLFMESETSGPAASSSVRLHLLGLLIMKYIVNNNQLMYFYVPEYCDFVIYDKSFDHYVENLRKVSTNTLCSVEKTGISLWKTFLPKQCRFCSTVFLFDCSSSVCTAPDVIFFITCDLPKIKAGIFRLTKS